MTQRAKWRETIARHRAEGRGRKAFWILVLVATLIAFLVSVQGFGHDRGRPQHARHGFAAEVSPEEFSDRVDQLLDHLDATDTQLAERWEGR